MKDDLFFWGLCGAVSGIVLDLLLTLFGFTGLLPFC